MKQLLVFSAVWCGPCGQLKQSIASTELPVDNLRVYDVDESPDVAATYSIRSVPTSILLIDGQIHARKSGSMSPKDLLKFCES